MISPFLTLYKDGQSKPIHIVDADAWIAAGWSTDPNSPATEAPVIAPVEASIEQSTEAPKPRTKKNGGE